MHELNNKRTAIIAISGGVLSLAAALLSGNPFIALTASALFLASLALWKYGYILIPIIIKHANVVEMKSGHEIPPSQDMVLKEANGKWYATSFLTAKITESTTEKTHAEKTLFMEYFERATSSLKCITKFSVMIAGVNIAKFEDEIKAKRSYAETKKTQIASTPNPNLAEISRLEREITMWNRQLERLNEGEKPIEVLSYIMTTASGASKEEAITKLHSQTSEVRTTISNALNAEVTPLYGEDMKKCFEWEYALPSTREELMDAIT